MEPILVFPLVYVLELESNKYYIGITNNLNYRYAQHLAGNGAKWTKMYKPIRVVEVVVNATLAHENEITKRYMDQYGLDNVRGGSWAKP